MAYWLCITNEGNWNTTKKRLIWGTGNRTISKNKKNWRDELSGKSMRKLPEEDFRLIMGKIKLDKLINR